ncbi:hypothetical protein ACFQ4O_08910 [Methylopila musalis]|uniref:Radical SAM protein n=1 Tax=Methylopila musalis TaxID=1134781 RepID=A0ABW3Z7H6_9HYPH
MTYGQFGGAEPALRQDVLRAAARHLTRGLVFSNGTIRLDPALPYAIHISVWGLGEQGARLRGADVFTKALRNYRDDPRATFVFTLNAENLESVPELARLCAEAGVRVSFSHFSPTLEYSRLLDDAQAEKGDYFRISRDGGSLMLDRDGLARAQDLIAAALDAYPETVVYSHAFNRWIHRPEGVYDVDPQTGLPANCGSRVTTHYRHFHTDMTDAGDAKCCTPNIDCRTCRLYAQSLASVLHRVQEFTATEASFSDWLDIWEHWRRLFLVERGDALVARPPAERAGRQPLAAA